MKKLFCNRPSVLVLLVLLQSFGLLNTVLLASTTKIYSINDGLSQSDVTTVVKDEAGFLWIGTKDGLNRFDGYIFKQYRPDDYDAAKSPSHQTITKVYKHYDGSLWIGTQNGLNRYLPETDSFKEYFMVSQDSIPNQDQNLYISHIERAHDGLMWVASGVHGIYLFHPDKGFLSKVPIQGIADSSMVFLRSVFFDQNGNTWVQLYDNKLFVYNPDANDFEKFDLNIKSRYDNSEFQINTIYQDKYRQMWFGTNLGLVKLQVGSHSTTIIPFPRKTIQNNIQKNIMGVFTDYDGELLVVNEFGDFLQLDRKSQSLKEYTLSENIRDFTHNNRITSFYQDETGLIWMGASGTGLIKLDMNKSFFNSLSFDAPPDLALSDYVIWSIYQDSDNIIWLGTDVGGLNRVDLETQKTVWFKHDPKDPNSISDDCVWAIFKDSKKNLWLGTGNGGLNLYNPKNNTFKAYKHDENDPHSIASNTVNYIFEDSHQNLWIGTEDGLDRFDRKKGTFEHFKNDPDNSNSLSFNRIGCIVEPEPGILWIGTLGGGINKFDYENESFVKYSVFNKNSKGLKNNYILSLFNDKNGLIWVGSWGNGLAKYDAKLDSFIYVDKEYSVSSAIHGIEQDISGTLWLSTNKGLLKYDPTADYTTYYTHQEGLTSDEFNTGAHFKNENGDMFFGCIAGLIWFSPEKNELNTFIPPIVITNLYIMQESVVPGKLYNNYKVLDRSIFMADTIHLSYKDNILTFEFAALNYFATEKNHYAYMMEGVDKEWIKAGNRRYAYYTNLNPGSYTFHVIGANNDGIWNRTGAQIEIIVYPPIWMTTWFRVLAIFVVVFVISAVYILQNRTVKKRNRYLQSINDNLEAEIHERKRFELELRDQKNFLETILNGIQEGICIIDKEDKLKYTNETLRKIMGYSDKELLNKTPLELFPEDQHPILLEESVKQKKGEFSQYEMVYKHPDGEKRYFRITDSPLFDQSGKFNGSIAAMLDITNLKNADENQKIMEAQLRHSQKMEIIGTLAGGIAHDFNNILVPIIGYTEISIDLLPKDGLIKTNLEKILKASKRAKDLVQQILAFSRQEQRGLEPAEVHNLVNEALKLLRSSFPSTIQIHSHIDTESGTILADPTQIHQVIMNLCTNAYHAMREKGGILDVTVARVVMDESKAKHYKHVQSNKPYVMIRVSDSGTGMDPAVLSRIFEPFFTTKKVGEGTGLGLSAVHGIVLSHGGDIHVDSTIGVGTVFEIYFPQHTEKAVTKKSLQPENIPQGNEHILFVDDEEEIVLLYQQILESLGYAVTPFSDSEKALQDFKNNPDKYDLVITDHTMPNLTGTELSKSLLEIKSDLPIIMCTGYSENVTQEKAFNIGIKEFIIKPLTMSNIATAIRKILDTSYHKQSAV